MFIIHPKSKRDIMKEIKFKVTNSIATHINYYLRREYKKDRRTSINKICLEAVYRELGKAIKIEAAKPDPF